MKANFLEIKREGWGGREKVLVKTCIGQKHFLIWKLESESQSASGDCSGFSSHELFTQPGPQAQLGGSAPPLLTDCTTSLRIYSLVTSVPTKAAGFV
jgi:hypothetical protein